MKAKLIAEKTCVQARRSRLAIPSAIRLIALLALTSLLPVRAQVPNLLNYQGRVAVNGVNFSGSGQFKFALVSPTGIGTFWSNDGTSSGGSQPTNFVTLTVTNGLYSVLLGDTSITNMLAIPASVWGYGDVRLRVWFNNGTNGFQLLTPDQRIAPNGYLPDGSVSATAISSGAITSAKIAAAAVTNTQLAAGAVQTANLAAGAVANGNLANSGVTITAGSGLGGGGTVALGGSVTLTNAGVRSLTGGGGITVNAATGTITLGSNATSANTPSALVLRDASGNFSAGTITGTFCGNGAALTNLNAANITTGSLTLAVNGFAVGGSQLVAGNGNVGVGTASPNVTFEIFRNNAAGPTLRLSGPGNFGTKVGIDLATYDPVGIGGGTASPARIEASDDNYSASISFQTKTPGAFANPLATRLFIQNDGNVGIGTTTPATALQVNGTITAERIVATAAGGVEAPSGVTPILGMIWIKPGTFVMGSPSTEPGRATHEGPQTVVTLTKGFWMGHHEVTQGEYLKVVGSNPSNFTGDLNRPVETVSWNSAVAYCTTLTTSERTAGRLPAGWGYRLPTEAEWEYACRAYSTTRFSYGDDLSATALANYAWYNSNSGNTTHPVAQKLANPWGLVDMHGNVWELCQDRYATYPGGSVTDPQGPGAGFERVIRGGSWYNIADAARCADRGISQDFVGSLFGFRVVLSPGQP